MSWDVNERVALAGTFDYQLELLYQALNRNGEEGLQAWSVTFDELREGWQIADCRRMLREIKGLAVSQALRPATLVLVRAAEGTLEAQLAHWDRAIAAYQQACEVVQKTGDRGSEASLLSNLGNIYYLAAQPALALDSYRQALSIYQELGDEPGEALVLTNLGNAYRDSGLLGEAQTCYERALTLQHRHGQPDIAAITQANLGSVLQRQGQSSEAEAAYQVALNLFAEMGDLHGQAQVLGNLGTLYLNNGQVEKALECFVRDLDLHQQLGDHISQAQTLNNLAIAYRRLGRLDDALSCYGHSFEAARQSWQVDHCRRLWRLLTGQPLNRLTQARARMMRGLLWANLGDWPAAEAEYRQVLPVFQDEGDWRNVAYGLNNLGEVLLRQGRWAEARDAFHQSVEIKRRLGDEQALGQALANLGAAHQLLGNEETAIQEYEEALAIAYVTVMAEAIRAGQPLPVALETGENQSEYSR